MQQTRDAYTKVYERDQARLKNLVGIAMRKLKVDSTRPLDLTPLKNFQTEYDIDSLQVYDVSGLELWDSSGKKVPEHT